MTSKNSIPFSFIDVSEPIKPVLPDVNLNLYTGTKFNKNNPWSPQLYIIPDTSEYAKYFYAPSHVSYDRIGNNENMNKPIISHTPYNYMIKLQ